MQVANVFWSVLSPRSREANKLKNTPLSNDYTCFPALICFERQNLLVPLDYFSRPHTFLALCLCWFDVYISDVTIRRERLGIEIEKETRIIPFQTRSNVTWNAAFVLEADQNQTCPLQRTHWRVITFHHQYFPLWVTCCFSTSCFFLFTRQFIWLPLQFFF